MNGRARGQSGKAYSERDKKRALQLLAEGLPPAVVIQRLSISKSVLMNWRREAKAASRPPKPVDLEKGSHVQ